MTQIINTVTKPVDKDQEFDYTQRNYDAFTAYGGTQVTINKYGRRVATYKTGADRKLRKCFSYSDLTPVSGVCRMNGGCYTQEDMKKNIDQMCIKPPEIWFKNPAGDENGAAGGAFGASFVVLGVFIMEYM